MKMNVKQKTRVVVSNEIPKSECVWPVLVSILQRNRNNETCGCGNTERDFFMRGWLM